ncbi:hypothetical protein B0T24DRAFT_685677 [Lasiosphaeria ovina]|uniref:TauD/TfdA-like domain-containing protein n=1 Tax=Lasiosphaeria ovina TaxID=92902 RepID=A0AAE0JRY2_9PEZI|nr:hypothetical protein B0T24DRAFT_685677 [Lasiosphaeria ovina]
MAPSAIETVTVPVPEVSALKLQVLKGQYKEAPTTFDKDAETGKKGFEAAKYPHYLPTWNRGQYYQPLQPFEHVDHGKDADPSFPNLLPEGSTVTHLTPTIGTEVKGIQLTSLNSAGKDELARLVAERKVVASETRTLRTCLSRRRSSLAVTLADTTSTQHRGPRKGTQRSTSCIAVLGTTRSTSISRNRISSVAWHSDVSYEQQPPGTTFLYILDKPETGGDTLFVDAAEAYQRLSPLFQERLHGLQATHSGIEQVNASAARGGIKRREPVVNTHPIVRTHPTTGEKALYVNPQFTRDIVGLKKEESDAILKFLYDHLAYGADFQTRVKWEEGTVVVWDNRVTQHSALIDWKDGQRRHLARITPQAERPFETPFKA